MVVCGLGAVTAQGPTADDLWEGVRAGRVAIRHVEHLDMAGYRTRFGGEVLDRRPPRSDYRRPPGEREPAIDFALRAAEEARAECGAAAGAIAPERWGVVVGTCNGGLVSGHRWYARRLADEPADAALLPLLSPQAIAEAVSGAFGLRGPCLSVNTACAAGANAVGYAADLIRGGHADAVLAGGSDALSDIVFAGFNALESLSPRPAAPYCRDRTGLSLGEGSGMVVLIAADVAAQLGIAARAEVLGYGLSADGYHATAPHPDGEGAARAIADALGAAGVTPAEVSYVNGHGTGTPKNDVAETRANRSALGDAADRALLSSTKSMIGHLLGAAGAVEGIVTVRALEEQIAPPTANYRTRDPDCDLDYVPNRARPLKAKIALSNNFAFAGANASLVLARVNGRPGPPAMTAEPVVVTGLAALTSAGHGPAALWEAFAADRRCIVPEDGAWIGRAALDPATVLPPRERRRLDRLGLFAVAASREALEHGGLVVDEANRHRVGVVVGTGVGPMESVERFARGLIDDGPAGASPAVFPNTVYNAAGGQVAMHLGTVGPASTVTARHAAGASALCYAHDLLASGRADAVLAVAADTLTDTVVDAYRALGMLAGEAPERGAALGIALAEGAVALLLERRASAEARGARVLGTVAGYGMAADGIGVGATDPSGGAAERAMRGALRRAGVEAADVGCVWSGLTGHRVADRAELAAIERLFGDGVAVEAPRLALGEPMGAGGSLNAALALLAWSEPDSRVARAPALVNSASLGGSAFALALVPEPNGARR